MAFSEKQGLVRAAIPGWCCIEKQDAGTVIETEMKNCAFNAHNFLHRTLQQGTFRYS
ncbi:MAG TPA: hypothetical protein VF797_09745 [Noviherbaspirillum sp.]